MLAVLRQPNCARLWLGGLISAFGSGMLDIALPFYVYQQTGSTLATGGLVVAQVLPSLVLGSVAGVLVDRWDRRVTMLVCDAARAGLILLLLAAPLVDNLWLLYVVTAAETIISLLFGQAGEALLPRLVRREDLVAANALGQMSGNLTRLAAPALGAAVLAVAGLPALILFDSASYLISAVAVAFIRLEPAAPAADHPTPPQPVSAFAPVVAFWREWTAGLRLIRADRVIFPLLIAHAVAMVGQGLFTVLLAPYLQQTLHASALEFGWLVSAQGVGGIIGGLLVGQVVRTVPARNLIVMGVGSIGVLLVAAAAVPVLPVTVALFAVIGVPVVGWMVSLQTLIQNATQDSYRGRVLGAFGTGNTAFLLVGVGLGSALGGFVAAAWLVALSGALFVSAGVVALAKLPREQAPSTSQLGVAVG